MRCLRVMLYLSCLLMIGGGGQARSDQVEFRGDFQPGGMVIGKVPENHRVIYRGKELVTDTGRFVFGFGRDVEPRVDIFIQKSNGQTDVRTFELGKRDYVLQRIEGIAKKIMEPSAQNQKRSRHEAALVKNARQITTKRLDFMGEFAWPLKGKITGVYGSQRIYNGVPKRPHYGLDIAGPVGAVVKAPANGVVTLTHPDMFYSGGTLIVDHGHGISSTFIHLSKVLVKEGQEVRKGDEIALVGASGRATGPHLDWRMNWYDERLDPALLLDGATEIR